MNSPIPQAMGDAADAANTNAGSRPREKGRLRRLVFNAFAWLVTGVAGFLLSEGLTALKFKTLKADDGVARLAEDQKQEFASLRDSLEQISDAIPAANRDQLRDIRSTLGTIENQNEDLVRVLALSRQENQRISQLAATNAGVGGSYSFILTENTGMPLDRNTTMGVGNISRTAAVVNLSGVGGNAGKRAVLNSGEGIDFIGADGAACLVSVVSISRDGAASFAVRCEGSLPA